MKIVFSLLLVAVAVHAEFDATQIKTVQLKDAGEMLLPKVISPRLDGRITNGQIAIPHQFPYQHALYTEKRGSYFLCGATLVDEYHLITAAHCADDAVAMHAILGGHNIHKREKEQEFVKVQEMTQHPKWDNVNTINDIAVLRLVRPIKETEYIKYARLPTKLQARTEDFAGQMGTITGWGSFVNYDTLSSNVLRYTQNPIISTEECNKRLYDILDTQVCIAGTGGRSACSGDSGGPLMITDTDGLPTQVGIASFVNGLGCTAGYPAVYTRVSSYLDFIEAILTPI